MPPSSFSFKLKKSTHKAADRRSRKEDRKRQKSRKAIRKNVELKIEESMNSARIKSAIEKGKQTSLPSESKELCLCKFEHVGKEGPLVVYAEDKMMYNRFGNYKVITSFRPPESVRNQLFFAHPRARDVSNVFRQSAEMDETAPKPHSSTISSPVANKPDMAKSTDSFEKMLARYKAKREKFKSIDEGEDYLQLYKKLDRMYKERKVERFHNTRTFSNMNMLRDKCRRATDVLDVRDHEEALSRVTRERTTLPQLTVKKTRDKLFDSPVKQDKRSLAIPKEKRGLMPLYGTKFEREPPPKGKTPPKRISLPQI